MPAVAGLLEEKAATRGVDAHDPLIVLSTAVYLLAITVFTIWHGQFLPLDQFFACTLIGVFLLARLRFRAFLLDWAPPILLLIGYDLLRGLTPHLMRTVHSQPMIDFDRGLFGELPSVLLQQRFFSEDRIHWYDVAAVVLYFLHFVIPMLVALVFWFIDRPLFKKFMTAMVVVSYLAFLTYCVFPAMPPWMASARGLAPPLAPVMRIVLDNMADPISLPTIYSRLGVNLVAAVPSLHAAFPLMMALFLAGKFKRWGAIAFLYPLAVCLAIVYLGEHYMFDIFAAICYTLAVWFAVTKWRWGVFRRAMGVVALSNPSVRPPAGRRKFAS